MNLPNLPQGYEELHGPVDPEVYAAAREIWARVTKDVTGLVPNEAEAQLLMLRAVTRVSQVRREHPDAVKHLRPYLERTFRRLAYQSREFQENHARLNHDYLLPPQPRNLDSEVLGKIRRQQILNQVTTRARHIILRREQGHPFADIAHELGQNVDAVKKRFQRASARLRQFLQKN